MRKWTVLFYANGNNDLEPENWKSVLGLQRAGRADNVNILIQIGRADSELVKILRPQFYKCPEEEWSGVRRYSYTDTNLVLLDDLGFINMADSHTLYEFIGWGMESYPAEHYMLILGGHAYQLVGLMPDYCQDKPYIMGFPEMCLALEKIGKKVDLLILDTCYCNCVEVLYELGKSDSHPVNNVLTYVGKGPISGLQYSSIIDLIRNYTAANEIDGFIRRLIDASGCDLVAIKPRKDAVEEVKKLCDNIARAYLSNTDSINLTPSQIITCADPSCPWFELLKKLRTTLQSMLLYGRKRPENSSAYINIQLPDLQNQVQLERYCRLSFARNNAWTNLLSRKPLASGTFPGANIGMGSMLLPYEAVYSYIEMMNSSLSKEKHLSILNNLKVYKNWA
ncbi:MAG TPA: clostripain-related cysteine peptidase [Clostridia bacterium]|nr:clostripain-related cysteine peptidase [Clostridia bacterium]